MQEYDPEFIIGDKWNSYDVVCLAKNIHHNEEDFDEGDIRGRIEEYDYYEIRQVPLAEIEKVAYEIDDSLVAEYSSLPEDTMPPVILSKIHKRERWIIDGCHRITTARLKKHKDILAFVPVA